MFQIFAIILVIGLSFSGLSKVYAQSLPQAGSQDAQTNEQIVAQSISEQLSGRILLQVQSHGEAWYIYPEDNRRYYLGRPADAFQIMRELGVGISNDDLIKIQKPGDVRIQAQNHPVAERLKGRIILQVEEHGEAWYINPVDARRYYLGRPADAFRIMRQLGLGISNFDLFRIEPDVVIENIKFDGIGSKEPDEEVVIVNKGHLLRNMIGWQLHDTDNHTYTFPNEKLGNNSQISIFTRSSVLPNGSDVRFSFESDQAIWDNDGDTGYLLSPNGTLIDVFEY